MRIPQPTGYCRRRFFERTCWSTRNPHPPPNPGGRVGNQRFSSGFGFRKERPQRTLGDVGSATLGHEEQLSRRDAQSLGRDNYTLKNWLLVVHVVHSQTVHDEMTNVYLKRL